MKTSQKILLAVTGLFVSSFVTEGEAVYNNKRKGAPLYDPARMNKQSPKEHEAQARARAREREMEADRWNRARGL